MDPLLARLQTLVEEAYKNAVFNGYNMDLLTDLEVAEDMQSYDAEIEKYFISDVVHCVEQYRKSNETV